MGWKFQFSTLTRLFLCRSRVGFCVMLKPTHFTLFLEHLALDFQNPPATGFTLRRSEILIFYSSWQSFDCVALVRFSSPVFLFLSLICKPSTLNQSMLFYASLKTQQKSLVLVTHPCSQPQPPSTEHGSKDYF